MQKCWFCKGSLFLTNQDPCLIKKKATSIDDEPRQEKWWFFARRNSTEIYCEISKTKTARWIWYALYATLDWYYSHVALVKRENRAMVDAVCTYAREKSLLRCSSADWRQAKPSQSDDDDKMSILFYIQQLLSLPPVAISYPQH